MGTERSGDLREAPLAGLERALIEEFLLGLGHTHATLHALPAAEAEARLKAASTYASGRLSEMELRAQYTHDLHDPTDSTPPRPPRGRP